MKTIYSFNRQFTFVRLFFSISFAIQLFFSYSQNCDGNRYKNSVFPATNSFLDVKYGSNMAQDGVTPVDLHMDIYTPKDDTDTKRPLVILAHGGFFSMGSKTDLTWVATELAKMGYVAATIQYRLLDLTDPAVIMNPPLEFHKEAIRATHDMRSAIRFFRKSVVEENNLYGIDPDMIIVCGYSAGAIMSNYTTYLDKMEEVPDNLKSYVESQGGLDGNSGNSGYSNKTQIAISLCGALGDTAWIQKNDAAFIGLHNTNDAVVPNISGLPLTSVGVPLQLTIYGDSAIYLRTKHLGISSHYRSELSTNPQTSFHCDFSSESIDFVLESLYYELCIKKTEVSLEHLENIFFTIYPNPSDHKFYVEIPNNTTKWTLSVFNSLGQTIFQTHIQNTETLFSFDISSFTSGIYTAQLSSEFGVIGAQKIIVR